MKTRNKIMLLAFCMVALIAVSVLGTMAYLTSKDTVVNTFTVGNVKITLDEARVNTDGDKLYVRAGDEETENYDGYVTEADGNTIAKRVKENTYKLLPGHAYNKDPMVTVLKDSESCYVKMTVTFSKANELDAIFAPAGADLTSIFNGYDSANWIAKGDTKDATANTRTYEFWYKETVDGSNGNIALDALFDSITVPGTITNEQLATIKDMTITVKAYAIQADGFTTPKDAWAAYNG